MSKKPTLIVRCEVCGSRTARHRDICALRWTKVQSAALARFRAGWTISGIARWIEPNGNSTGEAPRNVHTGTLDFLYKLFPKSLRSQGHANGRIGFPIHKQYTSDRNVAIALRDVLTRCVRVGVGTALAADAAIVVDRTTRSLEGYEARR